MTLTLYDLLAQIVPTLVIAFALGLYMRHWFSKLHTTLTALKQTSTAAADEQHTQTDVLRQLSMMLTEQTHLTAEAGNEQSRQSGLLERMLVQFHEANEMFRIANKPRLLQEDAKQRAMVVQQELAKFLINSGRMQTVDEQTRLMLYLPSQVRTLIDQGRYPSQSAASLLTTVVQAAAEYSALPALATGAQLVFNGSMTGRDFAAHCAYWQIPLPPKEGEPDGP